MYHRTMTITFRSIWTSAVLVSAALCAAEISYAQGVAGYEDIEINGKTFSLECIWVAKDALSTGNSTFDFFVHDNTVYFNCTLEPTEKFLRMDAKTGAMLGPIAIDWGGDVLPAGAYFVGTDSGDKPYIASYSAHDIVDTGYPFTICALDMSGEKPRVAQRFTMSIEEPWFPRDPKVYGSLESGNFRVVAPVWHNEYPYNAPGGNVYTVLDGNIVEWIFKDGEEVARSRCATANISECLTIPLDDERILVYDRNCCSHVTTGYDFPKPAICSFGGYGQPLQRHSELTMAGGVNGFGFDFRCISGETIACIGQSIIPGKFEFFHLPSFPESFDNHSRLWSPDEELTSSVLTLGHYDNKLKGTVVHSQPIDENSAYFYTMSNTKGIAKYRVSSQGGSQVGVGPLAAEKETVRYVTLTGMPAERPVKGRPYIRISTSGRNKIVVF